jgi:hypothetical protein
LEKICVEALEKRKEFETEGWKTKVKIVSSKPE